MGAGGPAGCACRIWPGVAVPAEEIVIDDNCAARAPVATPAPAPAWAAAAAKRGSQGDTHAKRDGTRGDDSASRRRRWINHHRIRVHRCGTIDHNGVVARDVNNLWIRRLDDDHVLA